jgi:hypothetical protein
VTELCEIPDHVLWLEFECGRDAVPLQVADAIKAKCVTTDDVLARYRCRDCGAAVWQYRIVFQRPGDRSAGDGVSLPPDPPDR